jgi:ketosteroid isomerase-like protein
MRPFPVAVLLALFPVGVAVGGTPASAAASAGPVLTDTECAVFARELSFAKSVADHDAKAFADHVGADAAFDAGGATPTRGRAAIVHAWAPIVEGKGVRLEWYPVRTTIGGVGDIAWSTGPALIERLASDATPHYLLGQFRSVWHRDADGAWRVLFDDGVPPRPATDAEAAAFRAARPAACPRA